MAFNHEAFCPNSVSMGTGEQEPSLLFSFNPKEEGNVRQRRMD